MAKEPRAGRVKTRLARDIGTVPAAWWQRHMLTSLARCLADPRWQTVLCVAPDTARGSPMLPALPRIPQGGGDLGARMTRAFHTAPPGRVLIVGADIPAITPQIIAGAFRALSRQKSVIGRTPDGGFWAVGLDTRRPVPRNLFANARWSTGHALTDTLATLPPPAFLPELPDIDTAADFARYSS